MAPTATYGSNGGSPSSSPLVAVLLIAATTSRGPQLVFRYPRKPRLLRRYSKVRYYAAAHKQATDRANVSTNHCDQIQRNREKEAEEERRRDRDQWEEQEEDSGSAGEAGMDGAGSDAQSLSSLSSMSSHQEGAGGEGGGAGGGTTGRNTVNPDDDDAPASESDIGVTTASSSADEDGLSEGASSAGPRLRGRRPGADVVSRLTAASGRSHLPSNSSHGGSASAQNFRSPSRPRASALRDAALAAAAANGNSSPERDPHRRRTRRNAQQATRGNLSAATDRENSPSNRARNAKAFSHYLGYPVDFLAELLAPREEMCNRRFELVVDDLAFVGHPVLRYVPEEDEDNGRGASAAAASASSDVDEPRGRRGRDGQAPSPSVIPRDAADSSSRRPPIRKTPKVTMFHLVFVLQPPDPSYATPTLDLTTWLGFWYDNATFKMTAALWAEETRCEYISQQTDLLSKLWGEVEGNSGSGPSYSLHMSRLILLSTLGKTLRHMYRALITPSPHRAPFVTLNDTLDVHLQLPPLLVEPARMVKSLLELGPSIEAEEADLWGGGTGNVMGVAGGSKGGATIASALDEWTRTTGPPLFPWKTLLLLHDPGARPKRYRSLGGQVVEVESDEDNAADAAAAAAAQDIDAELNEAGFADAGIELWARRFTSLLKPNLQGVPTFADLASLLAWDLQEDVYPMARHLIYYKQARVTDVPRIQNTYALSPLFEVSHLSRFATSFALRFPDEPPLARLLAALGSSFQPFISHYLSVSDKSSPPRSSMSRRKAALECLVWLLRHEVVLQQHLRFRLIATEAVKRKAHEMWLQRRREREERRRKREERREWKKEKRALKRGADLHKRKGDLVPLVPQSAPDMSDGDLRAHYLAKRAIAMSSEITAAGHRAGRGRPRSRSAERGEEDHDGETAGAMQAASRVSSSSRSRSRNPPLLGRVGPGGRIMAAVTEGSAPSRPTSSSGLRLVTQQQSTPTASSSSPRVNESSLEFSRRVVPRSRSPTSSNIPIGSLGRKDRTSSGSIGGDAGSPARLTRHRRGISTSSSGGAVASALAMSTSNSQPSENGGALQLQLPRSSEADDGGAQDRGRPREASGSGITVLEAQAKAVAPHMAAHHAASGSPRLVDRRISRSPSKARMRIRGFGEQEEVWIDGEEVLSSAANGGGVDGDVGVLHDDEEVQEGRRLSLVGEEATGDAREEETRDGDDDGDAGSADPVTVSIDNEVAPQSPMVSSDSDGTSSADTDEDDMDNDNETEPIYDGFSSLISEPSRASPEENAWIAAMVAEKDEAVALGFFQLLPYLNGRHTIDEIICREEMRRRELRSLLGHFKEEILTFVHP